MLSFNSCPYLSRCKEAVESIQLAVVHTLHSESCCLRGPAELCSGVLFTQNNNISLQECAWVFGTAEKKNGRVSLGSPEKHNQ